MTDHRKRPRDPVQLGKLVGDILTGQIEDRAPTPEEQGKDPAAVALGPDNAREISSKYYVRQNLSAFELPVI
jgi:hypothetical protein